MSIYICHVTDRLGRVHRVEVSGSDRTAAMRDALAKIPDADRVSLKGERNERDAASAVISPLDRYAVPRPPLRLDPGREYSPRFVALMVAGVLITVALYVKFGAA